MNGIPKGRHRFRGGLSPPLSQLPSSLLLLWLLLLLLLLLPLLPHAASQPPAFASPAPPDRWNSDAEGFVSNSTQNDGSAA